VCAVPVSPQVRLPPHDLDAETSVLGAILLDPAAITRILDQLSPDDFYRENNGQIYRAAQNLFRDGEPIDNVTLAAELAKLGVLEQVGGRAHLAWLQESVPTAANVEHYARIVKDRAYKRKLISAGTHVTALGYDEALDADEAVNAAQAHVYAISDDKVGTGMEHIYGLLKPAMDRIDAQMASGGGVIGIPSGFHDLDRMTNGFKAADLAIIAGRPSMGKALSLDTPIPTPAGWTTMAALRVGDQVFDDQGRPCTVVFATPVMHGRECFEVVFSDGEAIVADAEHQWSVWDRAARRSLVHHASSRGPRDLNPYRGTCRLPRGRWAFRLEHGHVRRDRPSVLTTRQMSGSLFVDDGRRLNYSIPTCGALQYPWRELPIDPYLFGAWLGDGDSRRAVVTTADREIAAEPAGAGHEVGVLANEHVPQIYLESDVGQRLALLQGLMDADGSMDANGYAELCTTSERLADGVRELATGLGIKVEVTAGRATLNGGDCGPKYRVRFKTALPVFRQARKAERQTPVGARSECRSRYVREIRPVGSVPVRCIQVDSPSHLYLAGRACIPTHNTSFVLNVTLYAAVEQKKPVAIFSLEMSKEQLVERMLCEQARIDAQRLHRGTLSDIEYERLAGALGPLGDAPIFIDDSPTLDDLTMRLKARQARSREGVELIVLDYLQLMHGRSRDGDANRVQEVSAISRALKGIARELSIPVIAISQLSRAPEARPDKRPILSDLRESGCLTGDTGIFLPDAGTYRSIADLVGATGFRVLALDTDTWELEPRRVTNSFSTGVKPVFRLTTRLGRTVRATGNHKFLAADGWTRLDELGPGDRVAVPRRPPGPEEPSISERALHQVVAVAGVRDRTAARIVPDLASTRLGAMAIGDVYWDEVTSIEPDGEEEVFDLTVDGLQNFTADNLIVHNSIEQDADIVMFLYRDDYYNREKSEKPGIAEVIVAKHRNGPTGMVELVFRKELTRFENMERRRPEVVGPE
jgi:replicative DNA helicase